MVINKDLIEVLNDLIQINNDRIEGYKRASKESDEKDTDLNAIFNKMADESRQYVAELTREIVKLGGEPAAGTTASGKIYRTWMDIQSTFTGSDRFTTLSSCENGEDAAQTAYKDALDSDQILSGDIRQLIENQKASLRISHDTIKKYRDMNKSDNDNISNSSTSGGIIDVDNYKVSDNYTSGSDSGFENVGTSQSGQSEMDNLGEADRPGGLGNQTGTSNIKNNL